MMFCKFLLRFFVTDSFVSPKGWLVSGSVFGFRRDGFSVSKMFSSSCRSVFFEMPFRMTRGSLLLVFAT